MIIKTVNGEYKIIEQLPIAIGEMSTIYYGDCIMEEVGLQKIAVKVFHSAEDNDLAQNETFTLNELHQAGGAQCKHLPIIIDTFRTESNQAGVIFEYLDQCYNLFQVREKYPDGIDRKHVVWMLNRALSGIGYAHSLGKIHANIAPQHLMIRPYDHNLFFIDWTSAVTRPAETNDCFKILNDKFSPPEVADKKSPLPSCDIYSLGLCMIYLLGGNVEERIVPDGIEEDLARFLEVMTMKSPLQRPQDAWELHAQLNSLVIRLWGPKRFLHFRM